MKDLRVLAEENGLDYVSTTDQANGYPSNIQIAILGFETWKEAEKFSSENELKLIQIEKKDGWQVWHRRGDAHCPISVSADDFGANYRGIYPCSQEEFFENEVKEELMTLLSNGAFENLDELMYHLEKKLSLQNAVLVLEDGEFALMNSGNYIETVKSSTMRCHIDATTTAIAAIDDSTDCEKVHIKTYNSNAVISSADDHANIYYSGDDLEAFDTEEEALEYYKERIISQLGFVPENIDDIMRTISIHINHKF